MPVTTTMGRISETLRRTPELSLTVLALCADVPVPNLTAASRGRIYLGAEEESRIYTLAVRCSRIIEALRPLTIVRGDADTLRALIDSEKPSDEIAVMISQLLAPKGES